LAKPSEKALQVHVPERVKRQLAIKAAEQGLTQRSIVLQALKNFGFQIDDEEIDDRRKGA
jgi:predicted HicB family RNase H-like nuclease